MLSKREGGLPSKIKNIGEPGKFAQNDISKPNHNIFEAVKYQVSNRITGHSKHPKKYLREIVPQNCPEKEYEYTISHLNQNQVSAT